MPKYIVNTAMAPTWTEHSTFKSAWRYAYSQARYLRRLGMGWTCKITRVYDGDGYEYSACPISRVVEAG